MISRSSLREPSRRTDADSANSATDRPCRDPRDHLLLWPPPRSCTHRSWSCRTSGPLSSDRLEWGVLTQTKPGTATGSRGCGRCRSRLLGGREAAAVGVGAAGGAAAALLAAAPMRRTGLNALVSRQAPFFVGPVQKEPSLHWPVEPAGALEGAWAAAAAVNRSPLISDTNAVVVFIIVPRTSCARVRSLALHVAA